MNADALADTENKQEQQKTACSFCTETDVVRILNCKLCGVGCAAARLQPQANDAGSLIAELIARRRQVQELEEILKAYRSYAVGSGVFVHQKKDAQHLITPNLRDFNADRYHIETYKMLQNRRLYKLAGMIVRLRQISPKRWLISMARRAAKTMPKLAAVMRRLKRRLKR